MTNWFIRDGKVLTINGKIRGCCCEEVANCSIPYRVSPYQVIWSLDYTNHVKYIGTYYPDQYDVYGLPTQESANVTADPLFSGRVVLRCDSGVPHVWLRIGSVYTTDLGEAPASGSLQYQFTDSGNTITITVTAL